MREIKNLLALKKIGKLIQTSQPSIVEMMGFLLDHVPDEQAEALFKTIYKALPSEGHLFICNVIPNAERVFLKQVIEWGDGLSPARRARGDSVSGGFFAMFT